MKSLRQNIPTWKFICARALTATALLFKFGCGVEQPNEYEGEDPGGGCETNVADIPADWATLAIFVLQP